MKTFVAIFSADIVTTIEFILAMKQKISKISKKQINSYDNKDVI